MEVTEKILKADMNTLHEAVKIVNRLITKDHVTYTVSSDSSQDKSETLVTLKSDLVETLLIVIRLHEQLKTHSSTEGILMTCENVMKERDRRNNAALSTRQAIMKLIWLLCLMVTLFVFLLVISQSKQQVENGNKLLDKAMQNPSLQNEVNKIDTLWLIK